ncbi:hypothetical protein KR100_01330 [Synechococcus sp. KORDI-100]|nr:hypothetical protein KR100_01330 [Synechococcus sp. KORDI-100]
MMEDFFCNPLSAVDSAYQLKQIKLISVDNGVLSDHVENVRTSGYGVFADHWLLGDMLAAISVAFGIFSIHRLCASILRLYCICNTRILVF